MCTARAQPAPGATCSLLTVQDTPGIPALLPRGDTAARGHGTLDPEPCLADGARPSPRHGSVRKGQSGSTGDKCQFPLSVCPSLPPQTDTEKGATQRPRAPALSLGVEPLRQHRLLSRPARGPDRNLQGAPPHPQLPHGGEEVGGGARAPAGPDPAASGQGEMGEGLWLRLGPRGVLPPPATASRPGPCRAAKERIAGCHRTHSKSHRGLREFL